MKNLVFRKMRTAVLLSVFVSVILATVGCDEGNDTISLNVTQDNFCREIAEVTCHNAFQCCTGLELEHLYGINQTTTEPECRRDIELVCENSYSEAIYAFENGTATLDTELMEACLEALLAPEGICFPYVSDPDMLDACSVDMFIGKQGTDADCLFDFECLTDAYCGPSRKCLALPSLGDRCPDYQCASGLICEYDKALDDLICRPLFGIGHKCVVSYECEKGLFCSDVTGLCAPLLGLDSPCTDDESCESEFCLPGVCENDGTECYTDEQCGSAGYCSKSKDKCYTDDDCDGYCSNNGDYCKDKKDCGECAKSGKSCQDDKECEKYKKGDTCEFGTCDNEKCEDAIPGVCSGPPVCAEYWDTLDYCELSILFFKN